MKKTFFLLFGFILINIPLIGQSTWEMVPCDSQIFRELLQTQLAQINKQAWKDYQISNTILERDSASGKTDLACQKISNLNIHIPKRGDLNDTIINGNKSQVYYIYPPVYDPTLDRYLIKVFRSDGEWGGATLNYYYKKTRRKFKFTKFVVVQTTC